MDQSQLGLQESSGAPVQVTWAAAATYCSWVVACSSCWMRCVPQPGHLGSSRPTAPSVHLAAARVERDWALHCKVGPAATQLQGCCVQLLVLG